MSIKTSTVYDGLKVIILLRGRYRYIIFIEEGEKGDVEGMDD